MAPEPLFSIAGSSSTDDLTSRRSPGLNGSRSFSRMDTVPPVRVRSRASTLQSEVIAEVTSPEQTHAFPDIEKSIEEHDVFIKSGSDGDGAEALEADDSALSPTHEDHDFGDMPIELVSLTDRFIESLTAKVHPVPANAERLSELFQDFYVLAASHIATHISMLSSRQHRETSPTPSIASRSSSTTKLVNKVGSGSSKDSHRPPTARTGSEMLTAAEVADRRRARKLLELKRLHLEEAVEHKACESIYDRIWRHRSTHDEERDEKLRSRTAALSVVGIGLRELGIEIDPDVQDGSAKGEDAVRQLLSEARESLMRMNEKKSPAGKLSHLKAAHKSIVDTLSRLHPSSSSADEILPTLIFTLITTPTEGINVISNLFYIQRFRAASKIDGEAAYCLTNLEAAVTFLETVDLTSLRADEAPEGPAKSQSRMSTLSNQGTDNGAQSRDPSLDSISRTGSPSVVTTANQASGTFTRLESSAGSSSRPMTPTVPTHARRLSQLLQPPSQALGAAGDAVLSTADQGLKTIGNSLETSYKFLFGRLRERQVSGAGVDEEGRVLVPKTLDEARKLVGASSPTDEEDTASLTGSAASAGLDLHLDGQGGYGGGKMLGLIGGRGPIRERSVDSTRSGDSGNFPSPTRGPPEARHEQLKSLPTAATTSPGSSLSTGAAGLGPAVESMRSLGNTLNPLNRFAGMNVMRSFSRAPVSPRPAASVSSPDGKMKELDSMSRNELPVTLVGESDEMAAVLAGHATAHSSTVKILPPLQKFLDIDNPGELRISEVLELLRDYRRLATALKDVGAF